MLALPAPYRSRPQQPRGATSTVRGHATRRPAVAVLTVILAGLSVPARGAESILLVPADAQAAAVAQELRSELARAAAVDVRLFDAVAKDLGGKVEPSSTNTAAGHIAALEGAARSFYYHQAPLVAARRIDEAIAAAVAVLPALLEREKLWDAVRRAQLLLVTAALDGKREEEVTRRCRMVLERDLDWEPPARDFAPPARARFAAERAAIVRGTVTLKIVGPAGTRVFVQGLSRGEVPVELRVPVGNVTVQGLEELVLSPEQTVAVAPSGTTLTLAVYCSISEHLAQARCAPTLRERAGTTKLWRLRATGQTLAIDTGAGLRSTILPLRIEARWLSQLAAWLLGTRPTPPELSDPLAVQTPIYKRWWFWTAVGVLAAGALTTYLAVPKGGALVAPSVNISKETAR